MGARTRLILALALLAVGVIPLAGLMSGERAPDGAAEAVLERLPLAFEENVGQLDPSVRFVARTPGQSVLLTADGLVVSPAGVRVRLEGSVTGATAVGERRLPGTVNRLTGDDPSAWRTGVPTYEAVTYRGVYPGIDVTYYGTGRLVEHDFVVAPGVDPGVITLGVEGGRIDGAGALVAGDVSFRPPVLYQQADDGGGRRPVEGRYIGKGEGRFGFEIGAYDRSRPLVIDPVLVSSSYLGGTSTDTAYAVAVDVDGNIVVTGYTESPDFPVVSPAQAALVQADGTRTDVFVTKIKADGGTVLWSTYLGGKGRDAAFGVAVGPDTGVWLTGYAESSDFPTVRPLQPANAGTSDVFVAKLNPAGSALEFSTFLGGVGADSASGIAVDKNGVVFVVGSTGSANFPKVRPIQPNLSRPDDVDGFLLRIEPNGASLNWSTYLGGAGDDHVNDVAIDGESNVYVTGDTKSANFPTAKPFQAGPGGAGTGGAAGSFSDAFVAKVKADGSSLIYSSYLGGADSDKGTGIAVDGQGAAYVAGNTGSTNFPVVGAAQSKKDGDFDAFVTKIRPEGAGIAYSSYLGGTGSDGAESVAVDTRGHAHVTGATASSNFPSENAFQGSKGGGFVDAFVTEVAASGSSWVASSYLGGKDDDQAAGIAIDPNGNAVIVGYTNSAEFPVLKAFQPGKGGGVGDAFITKAQGATEGGADTPAAAAERRDRRIKTLVTVTGGLFLAAFLQGVWLRRRPESAPRPPPRPAAADDEDDDEADEILKVPGMKYVPRRAGAPGLAPIKRPAPKVPAGWGDDEPVSAARPVARRADGKPIRPRPVREAAKEKVGSRMAAPDLWAPVLDEDDDADEVEVVARREPARSRRGGRSDGLDVGDHWGPLSTDQDPDEWAAEWIGADLFKTAAPAEPAVLEPEPEPEPEPAAVVEEANAEVEVEKAPVARRAIPPPPAAAPAPVLPPAPIPVNLRRPPAEAPPEPQPKAEPVPEPQPVEASIAASAPPITPDAPEPVAAEPDAAEPDAAEPDAAFVRPAEEPPTFEPAATFVEPADAAFPPTAAPAPLTEDSPAPPAEEPPAEPAAAAWVEPAEPAEPEPEPASEWAEPTGPAEPTGLAEPPDAAAWGFPAEEPAPPAEPEPEPDEPDESEAEPAAPTTEPAPAWGFTAEEEPQPDAASTIAEWATSSTTQDRPPFFLPPGDEGFAAAGSAPPPHDDWLVPSPPPPEPRPDLSIHDLLSEDLPFPEPAVQPPPAKETARVWLRDLLDEEMSIPDPSSMAGGTTDEVPTPEEDYVPPPPSRLLANLFEPDPDDPLVQSLRAREAESEEDESSQS